MIKFKLKLFGIADKRDFYNTSETAIRDLIKILVMGYHPWNANHHWIEVTSNSILGIGRKNYTNKPKLYAFLGVSFPNERPGDFNSLVNNRGNETPEDFIRRLWNETALQKDKGKLKYPGMIKPNPTEEEVLDILEKIRFITLCLSNQMKPTDFNWDKASMRTQINFNSREIDRMTVPELSNKIAETVKVICPGINL